MQNYRILYTKMKREVRDALWQWLIDHSEVTDTGSLNIRFYVSNEDDMWRRVYYRYTGQYERYNKEERKQGQMHSALMRYREDINIFGDKCQKIDTGKSLNKKFVLWLYRKTRDKIKSY